MRISLVLVMLGVTMAHAAEPFHREFTVPAPRLADGRPATVVVTEDAASFEQAVTWRIVVTVDGAVAFESTGDDAWLEPNYRDPGFRAAMGCPSYEACKREWLQELCRVEDVDARTKDWSFLADPGAPHGAAVFAENFLQHDVGLAPDDAARITASIVKRLASGPVQVLSAGGSPLTDTPMLMYVSELKRFVPIYGP